MSLFEAGLTMRATPWSVLQSLSHATRPATRLPIALWKRTFSSSACLQLRTSELADTSLKSIKVDPDRLWDTIHSTAKWTEPKSSPSIKEDIRTAGLSRLTLGKEDRQARDWFVQTTESLGCKTYVDQIGNIFAIRPGLNSDDNGRVPATFAGSHLDSQPSGGRFDGVLGVAAGVEMLRVLNDNWIETEGPVGVVNWTNEEGAKYPISMMGSGVWAGRVSLEDAWNLKSVHPVSEVTTVKQELESIGYLGSIPASHKNGVRIGAHFELHLEQGPKLEVARQAIGVVEGVQAYKWFTVTIKGRESHAGTTDFANRADALYSAATFITMVREVARSLGGLASVGMLAVSPSSVNTVPGEVRLSLDIRHPSDKALNEMLKTIQGICRQIESNAENTSGGRTHLTRITIDMKEDFASNAVKFSPEAIRCVEQSATDLLGEATKFQRMTSGAGHDSVCTSMHCPTAMIFIPCKDGISHNPSEWCEKEDCAIGANVLLHSVLRMDRLRKERGEFE
ncbi:hypothetical protein A1O1_06706 [Capronia coronata CBS 617.96]|uniref:Peptidase M20 dimerisation domain-containing protein n=1 Tax=Capronia coronata CBS 617.96 TaxID=1182541 RepID=W9XS80_9EURO|nr:uncharacterized protein A1O1_06706 [Capronia coronata CBS 617.96]EXJ83088.1 hypothetical protein A1O1_06706 [Capronia coronata CBS 617.96]